MSTSTPTGANFQSTFGDINRGGVSDKLRDRMVREEQERLKRQQHDVYNVYNLHSYPLTVYLGELGVLEVPACEGDTPGQLRIDGHRLSMRDMGDGNFSPMAVFPNELAAEVQREYGATGGVIVVKGDHAPTPEETDRAKAAQAAWWRSEYQKAVDAWTRYHQHKMITDRQREAARQLHERGEIAVMPEWVTVTRAAADRRECPECGESIKAVAKICHFCRAAIVQSPTTMAAPAAAATEAEN